MNIVVKENIKFTKKDIIISVPKRFVKKANKRNKIKRQMRAILQKFKDQKLFIQYLDNNIQPLFLDLKKNIEEKIAEL